jgi:hypothetical protein
MMVRAGMGPAVCLQLDTSYEDLVFIPFEPEIQMHSALAWKDMNIASATVQAFIRYCRQTEIQKSNI